MGTILFSWCITWAAKCMTNSNCRATFVVVCFIKLIFYMFTSLTQMIDGDIRWIDILLEITTVVIVVNCLSKFYRLYKLNKPANENEESSINKNLIDEQNNSSYPPQVMQPVPQAIQHHLNPQPIVKNSYPNHGYYPGPPMDTMYENNYIKPNNSGYNI